MSTFQPLIPVGTTKLNVDYANIQGNFQQLDTTFNVDHTKFSDQTANNGYHTTIHQITRASSPAPIPVSGSTGITQLYSMLYTPNFTSGGTPGSQLFMTNNGGQIQMTGTGMLSEGYAWCNGLLVQWGSNTPVSSGSFSGGLAQGTVDFQGRTPNATILTPQTIPFPQNCFAVIATPYCGSPFPSGANSFGTVVIQYPVSKAAFNWQFSGGSSTKFTGFNWIAVGN